VVRLLLSAEASFDAAIREMRRALELDPLSRKQAEFLAATLHRAGRTYEALQYSATPLTPISVKVGSRRC